MATIRDKMGHLLLTHRNRMPWRELRVKICVGFPTRGVGRGRLLRLRHDWRTLGVRTVLDVEDHRRYSAIRAGLPRRWRKELGSELDQLLHARKRGIVGYSVGKIEGLAESARSLG